MTTFLFVRHGHSLSNASKTFTGRRDVPLSEIGMRQAELASSYILRHYRVDAICASSLCRAVETMRPLSRALSLPIVPEPDLCEIFGGAWEGLTMDEIARTYPQDYLRWINRIGLSRPTGGEAVRDVAARALACIRRLAFVYPQKTVAVATHAGVLRTLECAWLSLPLSEMHTVSWIPNGAVSEVACDGERLIPIRTRIDSYLADCTTNLPTTI